MICLNCRKPNDDRARFCYDCGTVLPPSFEDAEPSAPTVAAHSGGNSPAGKRVDPLIGLTLDNRYRIDRRLGSGGMGTVYVATRLHIDDIVAVKILELGESADPHSAERFRREAQATARLKHPNAVGIYDFGITPDGLHYLVMELVEGQDLRAIIKHQGPLSPSMTLEIVTQVCAALEEAHRQNIIHRDVKPDNIIVTNIGNKLRVKVLDFGVAKLCDLAVTHITQAGSVMGTPHYMSPEQCMGEEIDKRSDIYSLGVVIYEMMCGVVPFNAPSTTAVAMQHVNQPPPPPRARNVSITPAVEAVILHSLEKRRETRPQTASALAQELNTAVYGTPTEALPRYTPVNNASVTARDAAVASGMSYPMFTRPPESGNRFPPPPQASGPQYYSGAAPQASAKRNYTPFILGGALLLVIAGGTIGVVAWMLERHDDTDKTTINATPRTATNENSGANAPTTQPPPGSTAADAELLELKAESSHAKLADHPRLIAKFEMAEKKYPNDYRFPYERAKLEVEDEEGHEETVVEPLFIAGQIALSTAKADEMVDDLLKEENHKFREFSKDHKKDWVTLIQALKNKDKGALDQHAH
jgi:serine/threonine-protein kinase